MSAVSRWTFYTPIIVAIIGIIGTIITVLGPSILTALSGPPNSPNIRLLVEEGDDKDKDKAKFILENVGTAPATNLTLSIDSPIKIINVTKKAGITDVFLPQFNNVLPNNSTRDVNSNTIQMNISKLTHGEGSLVELETTIDGNQTLDKYRSFVMYDQGSTAGKTLTSMIFDDPILLITVSFVYPAIIIYYIYYFRKRRRRKFIDRLLEHMVVSRRVLKEDPLTRERVTDIWSGHPDKSYRRFVTNIEDYVLVDDTYKKLAAREKILDTTNTDELRTENQQSLKLIEKALRQVNWDKYR